MLVSFYSNKQQATIKKHLAIFFATFSGLTDHKLWLVLENFKDTVMDEFLLSYPETLRPLFKDSDGMADLQDAGPQLLQLKTPAQCQWVIDNWGKQWFTLFVSHYPEHAVHQQVQHLFSLGNAADRHIFFRFYDPLVFHDWLLGLAKLKSAPAALGIFDAIVYETLHPHELAIFYPNQKIHAETGRKDNSQQRWVDLREAVPELVFTLSSEGKILVGDWNMDVVEWDSLDNVFTAQILRRLRQRLVVLFGDQVSEYSVEAFTAQVQGHLNDALKHGITQEHLLWHYVEMFFRYPDLTKHYQQEMTHVLSDTQQSQQAKMEFLLERLETLSAITS